MLTAAVIGNLGSEPETKFTPSGAQVCSFSVASTTGTGEAKKTEWVRVSVWGKQAEMCQQYLAKGRKVYVSGRLNSRAYDGSDGQKRFSLDLNADSVQFIDSRPRDDAPAAGAKASDPEDFDSIPF